VKLIEVDPFKIRFPSWDVRYKRDPEWVQRFIGVVARDGVKDPIVVYEPDDFNTAGEYELIDGKTRLLAAKQARLKTIPALVVDRPKGSVVVESGYRNLWQRELDPISAAMYVEHIVKKYMMDFQAASLELHISERHIRRLLGLLSLPEEEKRRIALGEAPAFPEAHGDGGVGHRVKPTEKRGGFGQRCVICGRWPDEGHRKWILICTDHEDAVRAVEGYINSRGWTKSKDVRGSPPATSL